MDFINRTAELSRLNDSLRLDGALVVVWGRRRVGKTRLLLDWAMKNGGIYVVADQSSPTIQRSYFAEAMEQRFPGFASVEYPTWTSLLQQISRVSAANSWKGPLVVDELPYYVQSSPELPSELQRWIDRDAKKAGLLVVVAGSSQRMMQGLILDHTAPLYGRAAELLHLQPLEAGHLRTAFPSVDPKTLVEYHAIAGGIPRYWELIGQSSLTLPIDIIDRLVLDPMSPLHREPDRLLLEETPPATSLRPILDAIGLGAHRTSEIGARAGIDATALSKPLNRLVEMGLITREVSHGDSEKSGKRALYIIGDPFLRLWFRIVGPHRALLAQAPAPVRQSLYAKNRPQLMGAAWEELCRRSVSRLHQLAGFSTPEPWMPARRYWRGSEPEWDVVAESVDGKSILLGEAKWFSAAMDEAELSRLCRSVMSRPIPPVVAASGKELHRALFVPERETMRTEAMTAINIVDAGDVLDCLR